MSKKTSAFTPINVIIWCCVLVFVAVSVAMILNLFTDDVLNLSETQENQLFKMFLGEIAAIGVAVFGRAVGGKQQAGQAAGTGEPA